MSGVWGEAWLARKMWEAVQTAAEQAITPGSFTKQMADALQGYESAKDVWSLEGVQAGLGQFFLLMLCRDLRDILGSQKHEEVMRLIVNTVLATQALSNPPEDVDATALEQLKQVSNGFRKAVLSHGAGLMSGVLDSLTPIHSDGSGFFLTRSWMWEGKPVSFLLLQNFKFWMTTFEARKIAVSKN